MSHLRDGLRPIADRMLMRATEAQRAELARRTEALRNATMREAGAEIEKSWPSTCAEQIERARARGKKWKAP